MPWKRYGAMSRWPNLDHATAYTPPRAPPGASRGHKHLSEVFDNGNPVLEDAERHIRDLRAKVGELTMERDFLAGALGRFGPPSAKR